MLPDLRYTEYVTVLSIMNGCLIGDVARGFEMYMLTGTGRKRTATEAALDEVEPAH